MIEIENPSESVYKFVLECLLKENPPEHIFRLPNELTDEEYMDLHDWCSNNSKCDEMTGIGIIEIAEFASRNDVTLVEDPVKKRDVKFTGCLFPDGEKFYCYKCVNEFRSKECKNFRETDEATIFYE